MKISNRWRIIITAIVFNLLFEAALRGNVTFWFDNLVLLLFAVLIYLVLFIPLEDLIGRFKLKDYQFMIAALVLWLTPQLLFFNPDGTYMVRPPLILGINWPEFLFLVFAWYTLLQPFMAFYIGNRLFPRSREEYKPLLSKRGWIVWGIAFLLVWAVWRLGSLGSMPFPNPTGWLVVLVITAILAVLFWKIRPKPISEPPQIKPSKVMDILSLITVVLFLYLAFLFTPGTATYGANLIDRASVSFNLIINWSIIMALIFYLYRLISKKPIPV